MSKIDYNRYLKRAQLLRRQWLTRVPKRKVNLDVVSHNARNYKFDLETVKGMTACGSVGCIAGWAFALNRERIQATIGIPIFGSRLDVCYKYYGPRNWNTFFSSKGARLFGPRLDQKVSQWREGLNRLDEYIAFLKQRKAKHE